MDSQCVNKQFKVFIYHYGRLFLFQFPTLWSINIIKVLWCIFQQLTSLPCCLSKGLVKQGFLDIYLTTSFGVHNFGNT